MTPNEKLVSEVAMICARASNGSIMPGISGMDEWIKPTVMDYAAAQAAIAIVVQKAAEVARAEKVDAEDTGDEGDAIYNRACDDVANALLALSDRSREGK